MTGVVKHESKEYGVKLYSPDTPSICTWKLGMDAAHSPHTRRPAAPNPAVFPDILHSIGNTPLIKLNKIPQSEGIECDMYAKCEYLNPGGSLKDRIAVRMVLDAEENGSLKPGYTIIVPTSGNTGIGLAMVAAVRGYRCIIVMPERMSNEKADTLNVLGAEIVRTPTKAPFNSPESHFSVGYKLQKEIPNSVVLDQYRNASNSLTHYDVTADEILNAFDNKVNMVVIGVGTGGTIAGVGKKIKERCPNCKIIGADPEGSIMAQPQSLNDCKFQPYEVEGIGHDFVPTTLDRSVIDEWFKSNDKEGMTMARRLIKEEGLLCGGSSGYAMAVALKAAKNLKKGDKCVVLLPDGMRNYMTRFVSDNWMEARNIIETPQLDHWWWNHKIANVQLPALFTLRHSVTCEETIEEFVRHNTDFLPVVDTKGKIMGMATRSHLMNQLVGKKATLADAISKVLFHTFRKVDHHRSLGFAQRLLEKDPFIVIIKEGENDKIMGIMTDLHLLKYITSSTPVINGSGAVAFCTS